MSDPVEPTPTKITLDNKYSCLTKLLSGRFILTVVGAFCFYIIVDTVCQLILDKKEQITISEVISILSTVLIVVSNIFTFYFAKKGMETGGQVNGTEE